MLQSLVLPGVARRDVHRAPHPAGMKICRAVVILEDAGNLFTSHTCMPHAPEVLFPRQWSHRFQETWERMFFEHCFWWLPECGCPWERVEENVMNYSDPLFLSWPWMLKNLRTLGIHYLCGGKNLVLHKPCGVIETFSSEA